MAPLPVPLQNKYWATNPFGPNAEQPAVTPPQGFSPFDAMTIGAILAQQRLRQGNPFNRPIPQGMPGGQSVYDAQRFLEVPASPFLGLADLGFEGVKQVAGAVNTAEDYFSGTGFVDPRTAPALQPSAPLPGMPELLKAQIAESIGGQGAPGQPTTEFGFDTTTMLPGTPFPTPPKPETVPEYKPDFTSADRRLAAAKPQMIQPKGDKLGSFLEGAALAAGQVDPSTPWPTALAQMVSGGVGGIRELRLKQEEAELTHERELRQYELQRAGIDAQRAATEAEMGFKRAALEAQAVQQNFENAWKMASITQPTISANNDGSMIITTRKPDGSTEVKKVGFDDALKANLAVAQARAVSGKSGEYAMEQRLLKNAGPELLLGTKVNQMIGMGMENLLIPMGSPAFDMYNKAISDKDQELASQGLPDKMILANSTREKFQRIMQLIYTNDQVRQNALYVLFGIEPPTQAQPQAK